MTNKTKFDLVVDFLKNPKPTLSKTQEQNLKTVDKVLKPKNSRVVKFKRTLPYCLKSCKNRLLIPLVLWSIVNLRLSRIS